MDAFAKPSFKLIYDDESPISNQTAIELLRTSDSNGSQGGKMEVSEYGAHRQSQSSETSKGYSKPYLHRSSPSTLHLCSISPPKKESVTTLHLNESNLQAHRSRIVQNALHLLSPLKDTCLFHTLEWFTYSLCYGEAIKQFRALPGTSGGLLTPVMDNTQDSYVLGRWNEGIEVTKSIAQQDEKSKEEPSNRGTELMELVHFSSLEGTDSDRERSEGEGGLQSQTTVEGKGRYISQIWTDGTRCIINNELRSAEVQFHCSKASAIDRIVLIKEVTTCNYVVVVETPKTCQEPALAQVEEEIREIRCQPIVSDEELKRRSALAKEIAEGAARDPPSLPASQESKTLNGKGIPKIDREILKTSVESIMNRLRSAAGESTSELEVIVGWDEDGKFIIQPNIAEKQTDAEKVLGRSSSEGEQQHAGEEVKVDMRNQEKWDLLVEKLLEMEDKMFESHDADQYFHADSETNKRKQGEAGNEEKTATEAASKENENDRVEAIKALTPTPSLTPSDDPPSRTKQMVRETESFAQKVERFYKAQELQKHKDREDRKGKEKAAAAAATTARDRAEL
ncbi:hypothetical protein CBS101457_001563 [Exobasidium rhododendri]|nr:hypothetical protein CBS101457_001563 [Exobasidium rhododendri]